ncbi:MAG: hypothetical protein H7321_08355 [Bacteroidia bacterium]|nr:hypothetical protein [Bacteroidia bacterium]
MKVLKIILITLGVIIAVALIAAAILPKDYTVEREITINASKEKIFPTYLISGNGTNGRHGQRWIPVWYLHILILKDR